MTQRYLDGFCILPRSDVALTVSVSYFHDNAAWGVTLTDLGRRFVKHKKVMCFILYTQNFIEDYYRDVGEPMKNREMSSKTEKNEKQRNIKK